MIRKTKQQFIQLKQQQQQQKLKQIQKQKSNIILLKCKLNTKHIFIGEEQKYNKPFKKSIFDFAQQQRCYIIKETSEEISNSIKNLNKYKYFCFVFYATSQKIK